MNLYKITVTHYSQKDNHSSIQGYVIADNDEKIYDYIASEPEMSGETLYNSWKDKAEEEIAVFDDEYNQIGDITFKELMISIGGEDNWDDIDLDNLYYGKTYFGWSLVKESISEEEVNILVSLGIAVKV